MNQIDRLSGLTPDSELYAIRRKRPEYVDGAELCRRTVLMPSHGFGLSHSLRAALAARMARLLKNEELAHAYDVLLETAGTDLLLQAIAQNRRLEEADPLTVAILRHADLVTIAPRDSTRAAIKTLENAGLTKPQIIALSELIAFVNFEARIITGLSVLEQVQ